MFTRECVCPDQHVHFRVSPGQVMERATIRRLGAWAINLSNNSVRALLVSNKEFKKMCPLLRGEEDIIIDREDVLCPSLSGDNQSVTWLCWDRFINKSQTGVVRCYPVSDFHLWIAIGYNDSCDKAIPQRALHDE